MMDIYQILDFSPTQPPSPVEFISKITILLIIWISIISIVKITCQSVATVMWSRPIPATRAFLPSKLPHPNPPGGAVPFDVPLLKASTEQIVAFMAFRGHGEEEGWSEKEMLKKMGGADHTTRARESVLQLVANSAAAYKGELYEERFMKWVDDHFRLKLPNLRYPYVDRHWNGWSSFWIETGPHIRQMFVASMTILVEHMAHGYVLPILYLRTQNPIYYNMALYGEIAFLIYTSFLIGASNQLKRDVTIEQMHPAVWPLLLTHHLSALLLCTGCLMLGGDRIPKDLVCYVLLALLGFTSSLHYVGQILDFSPLSQANAPYTRLGNHFFCLASQLFFRGVYWVKLLYLVMTHTLDAHGAGISMTVMLVMLLFTAFNIDFVKYHIKATRGCIRQISETKAKNAILYF